MSAESLRRRTITGVVVSNKMAKTVTVRVERLVRHPKFGKTLRKYTTYYCHDEKCEAKPGDKVTIAATRPISKLKRWALQTIVERAKVTAEPVAAAPTNS